jgi:hypothetical protein
MATPSLFHDRAADAVGRRISAFPGAPGTLAEDAGGRTHTSVARTLRGPLIVAGVGAAAIAAAWGGSVTVLAGAASGVAWLEAHNGDQARQLLTTVIAATVALSFVAAWARATMPRRPVRLAGGRGRIAVGEIEERLRAALLAQPDVVGARVEMENRRRHGVWVTARLDVTPDARLEETLRGATLLTEDLVLGRLGLALATVPQFDLRYDELDLKAGRAHDIRSARARPHDAGDGCGAAW